jgi:hypothetical protein
MRKIRNAFQYLAKTVADSKEESGEQSDASYSLLPTDTNADAPDEIYADGSGFGSFLALLSWAVEYFRIKIRAAKLLTNSALVMEPLSSWFLYKGLLEGYLWWITYLGGEDPENTQTNSARAQQSAVVFCALLASLNLVVDLFCINPVEEAYDLVHGNEELDNIDIPYARLKSRLIKFSYLTAFPPFAIFASSDLVPLSTYLNSTAVKTVVGIPVVVATTSYFYMFSRSKLKEHISRLVDYLTGSCKRAGAESRWNLKEVLTDIEVFRQASANWFYRAILGASIFMQMKTDFFKMGDEYEHVTNPLLYISVALIFETWILTRTIQAKDRYYDPEFNFLSHGELEEAKSHVKKANILFNGANACIQGFAIAWTCYTHIPTKWLKWLMSGVTGLMFFYQKYIADQKRLLRQTAKIRKMESDTKASVVLQQKIQTASSTADLFKVVADEIKKTSNLKNATMAINACARGARVISFQGFAHILASYLKISLEPSDIIATTILLGLPIAAADGEAYQLNFEDTVAYYWAKQILGLPSTAETISICYVTRSWEKYITSTREHPQNGRDLENFKKVAEKYFFPASHQDDLISDAKQSGTTTWCRFSCRKKLSLTTAAQNQDYQIFNEESLILKPVN